MKTPFTLCLLLITVLAAALGSPAARAQGRPKASAKARPVFTTVYIVRHAEKDTAAAADPSLSAVGQVRAQALRQLLLRRAPAALFTTDTRRTRATLAPLAEALKLEPQVYDPRRGRDLADRILKDYAGKPVVIVGHSNTVLSLIDDFGAVPPVDEIADSEYDYLFIVRVAPGAMPTVEMRGYGAERRPPAKAKAPAAAPAKAAAVPAPGVH